MDNTLIKVDNLTKSFGNEKAVNNVSFSVKKGEFLVVMGNSGCGKTTMLNIVGGLDQPDEGTVVVDDICLTDSNDKDLTKFRRDKVGFIYQSFNLMQELTVLENVKLVSDSDSAKKALESVGLGDVFDKYPSQLSGGQQQRVSIARALAKEKSVILCDEPTGALDYESGRVVLSCLIDSVKKQGLTMILVTHTREIACLADHVIVMKNGSIESDYYNTNKKNLEEISW